MVSMVSVNGRCGGWAMVSRSGVATKAASGSGWPSTRTDVERRGRRHRAQSGLAPCPDWAAGEAPSERGSQSDAATRRAGPRRPASRANDNPEDGRGEPARCAWRGHFLRSGENRASSGCSKPRDLHIGIFCDLIESLRAGGKPDRMMGGFHAEDVVTAACHLRLDGRCRSGRRRNSPIRTRWCESWCRSRPAARPICSRVRSLTSSARSGSSRSSSRTVRASPGPHRSRKARPTATR